MHTYCFTQKKIYDKGVLTPTHLLETLFLHTYIVAWWKILCAKMALLDGQINWKKNLKILTQG